MVTRILSAVVLAPLFFVVLFFLPPVFLAVLLACITARASFELLRATKVAHHNGMYVYTAAAAGLIPPDLLAGVGELVPGCPVPAADGRSFFWGHPPL